MPPTVGGVYGRRVAQATLKLTSMTTARLKRLTYRGSVPACRARVGPLRCWSSNARGLPVEGRDHLALTPAVDSGALRIIDVTFIQKDARSKVTSYELAELEETSWFPTMSSTRHAGCCRSEISQKSKNACRPPQIPGNTDGYRTRVDKSVRAGNSGCQLQDRVARTHSARRRDRSARDFAIRPTGASREEAAHVPAMADCRRATLSVCFEAPACRS